MNRETAKLLENLPFSKWRVLEVSGKTWETFGFQEYENINYPEYDICSAPLPRKFDLKGYLWLAEQLLWQWTTDS